MSDEIKEILDKIKKCLIAGYDVDIITQEELNILWDYITNLQDQVNALVNVKDKLLEENERLKNELVKIPRAKLEYELELENYKSRVEKAIEYIKSYNLPEDLGHFGEAPISIRELRDLLEFLQGGKDDNN